MDKQALRVIVAGGDSSSLRQLVVLLRRLGYEVRLAESAAEALTLMEAELSDLVILDGQLSAQDGITAQQLIKSRPRWANIPVIMLAARHSKTSQDEYIRFGYEGLLTPPFDLHQMNILVQEYLSTGDTKKRKNLRIPFTQPVTLIHCGKTTGYQPLNLSEGGIYLQTLKPLPVGAEVEISLPLPGMEPLTLTGMVIYQKGSSAEVLKAVPGMAIKFQPTDPLCSLALTHYISGILLKDLPTGADSIVSRSHPPGGTQ